MEAVGNAEDSESENLLWKLPRSHEERAALARRLAEREQRNARLSAQLRRRAQEYEEDATIVRQLLNAEPEPHDVATAED